MSSTYSRSGSVLTDRYTFVSKNTNKRLPWWFYKRENGNQININAKKDYLKKRYPGL